jgi:hypothetical protein
MDTISAKDKLAKLFVVNKPVIGVLHLKGGDNAVVRETAIHEIHTYIDNKVDGVLVENYFGSPDDIAAVLQYLKNEAQDIIYGVNVLDDDLLGFEYANKYNAAFIQLDSVSGHLEPNDDILFHDRITEFRKSSDSFVFGGVRFKYQPYKSGRSLEEDLAIASERCDAVVVTGNGTGVMTPIDKIKSFRHILQGFPLFIGAGLSVENCREQLSLADGAIVGSYFKDTYEDSGDVSAEHVNNFMNVVRMCR